MRRASLSPLGAAMVFSLLSVGCGEDSAARRRGSLTIYYNFEDGGCGTSGVDSLDVTLIGRRQGERRNLTVSCDPGVVTLYNLREDVYDVSLEAYGDADVLLYGDAFSADVFARADNAVSVTMPAEVGDLTLFWRFEGRSACLDVASVHVVAVDPFDVRYDDAVYPCEQEGVSYRRVTTGEWLITMDGLGPGGQVFYTAIDEPILVDAQIENVYVVNLELF